ncbi:acyltransferase [Kordiimonas sp. SCSIO 12610]|uniref:acyltransferase family protein n=1 Tax=Kordiimonas sp. SCSIO 12610 TaxID=2829597 RepID=UPI002109E0DC|nr:acyltransferase [Kordiimonas sp. SCSIO 12610]UTW56164.1 acyltransferase [Kordiimonas sp. SCSIO 12610]
MTTHTDKANDPKGPDDPIDPGSLKASYAGPASTMPARRYDIDALRVGVFGLLILYHVGMFYVSWGWHVKSSHAPLLWLENLMLLSNPWRLPLLFLISGLSVRLAWDKYRFLRLYAKRIVRLWVPLLFAIYFICAPQRYFEAVEGGFISMSFTEFWPRYIAGADDMGVNVPDYTHMWFIDFLLVFTVILTPVFAGLKRLQTFDLGARSAKYILIIPMIFFTLLAGALREDEVSHYVFGAQFNTPYYAAMYILGFLIGGKDGFWAAIDRYKRVGLGFGLGLWAFMIICRNTIGYDWIPDGRLFWGAYHACVWGWIIGILGFARKYLNKPNPYIHYFNGAVFPYYIVHQTIIIVAGFYLTRMNIPLDVEASMLIFITVLGCMLSYECIRRIMPLRPLFGLSLFTQSSARK